MITNFQSWFTWIIDSVCEFLTSEPIVYITYGLVLIVIIKIFKSLIS